MKKSSSKIISIALIFLLTVPYAAFGLNLSGKNNNSQDQTKVEKVESLSYKPSEVLVKYRADSDLTEQAQVKRSAGIQGTIKKIDVRKSSNIYLYKLKNGVSVNEAIKSLKNSGKVLKAEPNYLRKSTFTPNDPRFVSQWGLNNTGQATGYLESGTPDADIDAPEAWDLEKGDSNQVTAAVIDSGIDGDHPDLSSKTQGGYNWAGISQRSANTAWFFGRSNTYYRAQSIKGTGQSLSNIGLYIRKAGSPSANIVVSVRESLNGQDLRTLTISPSDVGTASSEVYKSLNSPITLTNGQTYYIVFRATEANDTNYYLIVGNSDLYEDYYGDAYAEGGQFWSDGSSWQSTDQNYDYWDWYFRTNENASSHDDNGHGTHISGIIGASSNNNVGVAGVSQGVKILPLKVTDSSGGATTADVISAITYAADNGAKVINISLGGTESSSLEQDAVNYAYSKGSTLFASAGNEAEYGNPIEYPAAYNNVISVGATTNNDTIAYFSNYNSYVDVSAPGEGILSTFPTYPVALTYWGYFEDYDYMDGTSMASPMAAGVASLILSRNPILSPAQVEQVIEDNADEKGEPGKDNYFGYGRINAYEALNAIQEPPNQAPTATIASISPNPATKGQNVVFTGYGADNDGTVVAYNWRSSIDSQLSTEASFNKNNLSVGTHTIYFKVQDNDGDWSNEESMQLTVNSAPIPQIPTLLSTLLSLKASPKTVKAGKAVTIKGQLKDSNGKPVAGKLVVVKANGKVIKRPVTNSGGVFKFKHKPKKTTKYQAIYPGDTSFAASSSKAAKVTVKKAKKKKKKR